MRFRASPLSMNRETHCRCFGGADADRTRDLLNAIQALSQLSYSPTDDMSDAGF
jgi:hypothetical protein